MKILYEMQESISLDMSSIFSARQITQTDITDATLIVKNDVKDLDEESLVTLTIGDGLEWDIDGVKLLATFRTTDWGTDKMVVGGRYAWGFGFKTDTNTKYIEVSLGDSHLCIVQDFIRN